MAELKRRLVFDEHKRVHIQVMLGQYEATLPLPDEMATWSEEQLKPFFEEYVPVMARGLYKMRDEDQRKMRKKAKQCSGSTKPSPKRAAPTSPALLKRSSSTS